MNDWQRAAMITYAGPAEDEINDEFGGGWKRTRSPLEKIAAHEGAHRFAAIALGKEIEHVTVIPIGATLGHMQLASKARTPAERIAALHVRPKVTERRRALLEFVEGLQEEQPRIGFRETRVAIREFLARVKMFLDANRRSVDIFAVTLAVRGTMSGAEVKAFLCCYALDTTSLAPAVAPKSGGPGCPPVVRTKLQNCRYGVGIASLSPFGQSAVNQGGAFGVIHGSVWSE